MANKGDVDLVIRAKNEASKAIDAVSKALDDLAKKQNDAGASAGKSGNLLDQFAKTIGVVAAAYDRLKSDADRAAQAFARQESNLNESKAAYAALTAQLEAAQRVQQRMASFVGPMPKGSEKQAQAVAKAVADLSSQSEKLARTIGVQQESLTKSFYALEEITGGAGQAAEALNKVKLAHGQAADAAAADAAAQAQAAQAMQRTAEAAQQAAQRAQALGTRRSALETRRDLTGAMTGAQSGQAQAQAGIKSIADAAAANGGQMSSDQIAQMQTLRASAAANKAAYNELRVALEQYNRVLRDGSATQDQIAAAQNRVKSTLAGTANLATQTSNAMRQMASAQQGQAATAGQATSANQKLDNALQSLFANSRRSLSLYQRWRGEVLSLISSYVGLMAAINGVNQVIQASMAVQSTESRLNVVTGGDPAKTAQELSWVLQQSDRLGFSMKELGSEWSKFAVAAQASNFSMAEARKIFMSVSGAGRVLKLDTTSMSQAFVALTQMMSKGTIQMEELRQQLGEHIPGAFALMAKAAGVSASELTKIMQKGQLTSDYLLKFADVLDEKFGPQLQNSMHMTQAEMGRFQTALTVALNEIADAGVIDAFTAALRKLQAVLKSDDAHIWFQRIGAAVGGVIKFLMAILDNLDLIMAAFAALGAAKGVAYVITLTQSLIRMITTIRAAATAGAALNITLAGLGGPIGLAIGVLAGAFAYLATRVSDSEKAMTQAQRATENLVASYQMGDKSSKEMADAAANMSALQIERTRGTLQSKLKDELSGLGSQLQQVLVTDFGQVIELPIDPKVKPIKDLVDAVKAGQVPLSEFKKRLDAIATANPDLKDLAIQLQDQAESAIKTDAAYRKFEAAIRLMKGTATDADKALLGIKTTLDDTGDAAARAAERFKAAMDNIAKSIPELKKQLDMKSEIEGIQRSLQAAIAAAAGDPKLIEQAKDRALRAIAAVKSAYDESLIKQYAGEKGDAQIDSVNLVKRFEGFQPTAKWDVNAYRAGYGSDTVTLSDGTIQKITAGMSVNESDAMRDLVRRIGDFQETIKNQIGADKYGSFTAPQQAALTSIAYNYGSLPKDIVAAIKYGTNETIAAAVRNHATDNAGVNADRRRQEADILAGPSPAFQALQDKAADARQDRVTKVIEDLSISLKEANLSERDKFIEEALKKAQPTDVNAPRLTSDQESSVRQKAGETFDAKQQILVQQKIVELTNQLAQSKAGANKEDFVALEAQKQKIDLTTEEGKKWASLQGQIWERANAEKQVNDLMALRQQLIDRFTVQQNAGDSSGAAATSTALDAVNKQLDAATQKAIAFWQSMGADNPQAQAAIAALQNTQDKIAQTGKVTLDAKAINQDFANGAVQGFDSIADSMAGWIEGTKSGKDVLVDIRNAFLKFAADFLKQIANMILQQLIFNAISGLFGGGAGGAASGAGGLGGAIAGLVKHNGGMVEGGGHTRSVSAGLFANAVRYHTGGIAGLQPGEMPAILQRGEEVLAKNDPRNIMNGGGGGGGQAVAPKIVNVLDPSLVQDHLSSSAGQDVLINVIRRNGAAIKQILSEA